MSSARYIPPEEDDRHYLASQIVRTADRRRSHDVPVVERATYPGRTSVWRGSATICGIPYSETHRATVAEDICRQCLDGYRPLRDALRRDFPDLVG